MGYTKREMLERQQSIIDFADVGEFIDAPVKQYSSGMYMRLAFAVATEVDPQILLVDEILAVGDVGFQEKCFEKLRRFRNSGKTIILVTHNMDNVRQHCERAILIDHGSILVDGTPDEAVTEFNNLMNVEVVAAH
jgi:ABC-type polysaccharide/polyol phosphate transport system ATPase subunit